MKPWLKWTLKFLLTAAVLGYVFHIIPISAVFSTLKAANLWYVVVGFGLLLLMRDATALRMRRLTDRQGMTLTTRQIFDIGCITSFYGLVLPGALPGALIRWHRLARQDRKPAQVLVAMMGDRLIDMTVFVSCGLAFWAIDPRSRSYAAVGVCLALVLTVVLSGVLLIFEPRASGWVWAMLPTLFLIPAAVRGKIKKLASAVRQYHTLPARELGSLVWLSTARHLIGIASSYYMALALGMPVGFTNVGWVRASLLIVGMLPISLSGLGVREVSSVFLLRVYGVRPADAVAWSFLLFSRTLLTAAIGAVLETRYLFAGRRTTVAVVPGTADVIEE